jgi:hypothetical protein
LLAFASVYFFESGLFNGLRPIQIKKSFPSFGSVQVVQKRSISPPSLAARLEFDVEEKPNIFFGFGNDLHSWLEALGAHPYGSYSHFSSWSGLTWLDPAIHVFPASKWP